MRLVDCVVLVIGSVILFGCVFLFSVLVVGCGWFSVLVFFYNIWCGLDRLCVSCLVVGGRLCWYFW